MMRGKEERNAFAWFAAGVAAALARAARILWRAVLGIDRARGLEAATTMAFFALFSLFPLLLILVAAGGTALAHRLSSEQILEAALRFLPVSRDLIRGNLVGILDSRGTVGLVGALGLLWASSSVFTTLTHNLTRAWPEAPSRGIVKTRLAAVLQVVVVVIMMTALLVAQTLLRMPEEWRLSLGGHLRLAAFTTTPSRLAFSLSFAVTLVLLYWWVPKVYVRWREALGGAAVASAAIHAATTLFIWYLGSGLARYNLVYGSLGALLALMTWAYIVSLLILYGAHVSAAIARTSSHRPRENGGAQNGTPPRAAPIVLVLFAGTLAASPSSAERPYSVQMHLHAHSNHNGAPEPASLQWHTWYAKENGVDCIWWSEHIGLFEMTDTLAIGIGGGALDSTGLSCLLPGGEDLSRRDYRKIPWKLRAAVAGGEGTAEIRRGFLRFAVRATGKEAARFTYEPVSRSRRIRMLRFARPLPTGLIAEAEIDPEGIGPGSRFFFHFFFAWHNYGTPTPYEAVFYLTPKEETARSRKTGPARVETTLPLPAAKGPVRFDLTEALSLLRDGDDGTLSRIELGIETPGGDSASAGIAAIRLWNENRRGAPYYRKARAILDRYEEEFAVCERIGAEFAWNGPHLTAFFPDSTVGPERFHRSYRQLPITEWVAGVHRAGGIVSLNHPFGTSSRLSEQYAWYRKSGPRDRAAAILETNAYGADILEAGYPLRGGVTLVEHLRLWDLLTANGLFLYGNGASDAHGAPWFGDSFPNWYVTWIWADDSSADALLRGMRAGRIFFGDPSRWNGRLDFSVGPHRAGDRVANPGGKEELRILVDPLPPGASVRLVQGLLADDRREVHYMYESAAIDPQEPPRIDLEKPCFVRIEVYESSDGAPLAFSNPIVFY